MKVEGKDIVELWDRQGQNDFRLVFDNFWIEIVMEIVKCPCSYCDKHLRHTLVLKNEQGKILWYCHYWDGREKEQGDPNDDVLKCLNKFVDVCRNYSSYTLTETEKSIYRVTSF